MKDRLTFEGNFCDIAVCTKEMCPFDGGCSQKKVWERLKHYEDLEEQEQMLKLPAPIGAKVYMIITKRPKINFPYHSFIKDTRITKLNLFNIIDRFGETVFLTRQEAEVALATMEGEKNG